MRLSPAVLITCLMLATGLASPSAAATEKYLPSVMPNPAPSEPLANFDRVEVTPVTLAAPFDKHNANIAARDKIQTHLDNRLSAWVLAMNTRAAKGAAPRVMVVEPVIEKIKFIGTGARIWAGALAGSSQVLMRVRLRDKETGAVVAEPQFYQRANAWGGAYSAGGTDRDMLSRITDLVAGYLGTNLETSVGGPTGGEGLE
jgi:hypothetical protein